MPDSPLSKRVLVVDDEVFIADSLAKILRISGYDAAQAYSAEEALVVCSDKCPDAVITDVIMGPMNGIQLAQHIADTLPHCRVLLISGHALTAILIQDSNACGYRFPLLPKPVHPQQILDFLAAV